MPLKHLAKYRKKSRREMIPAPEQLKAVTGITIKPQHEIVKWLTRYFMIPERRRHPTRKVLCQYSGLSFESIADAYVKKRMTIRVQIGMSKFINYYGEPRQAKFEMERRIDIAPFAIRKQLAEIIYTLSWEQCDDLGVSRYSVQMCKHSKVPFFRHKTVEKLYPKLCGRVYKQEEE